jgi:hypothetical protein
MGAPRHADTANLPAVSGLGVFLVLSYLAWRRGKEPHIDDREKNTRDHYMRGKPPKKSKIQVVVGWAEHGRHKQNGPDGTLLVVGEREHLKSSGLITSICFGALHLNRSEVGAKKGSARMSVIWRL